MKKNLLVVAVLCGLVRFASFAGGESPGSLESTGIEPLPQAHAHNDYLHSRPLLDALARGFCSVEADVFLVDGELRVGHDRSQLRPGRTLERLYLDPLAERVREHGGSVYAKEVPFTLLVDIKSEGAAVYEKLSEVLQGYADVVSGVQGDHFQQRAVQIVISGDRPKAPIAADSDRRVGIDGRLEDLESDAPAHLMPLISDRWTSHFRWRGDGEMPRSEREQLIQIVRQAHRAGRRVRFWATPEKESLWRELVDAGVDHINTDQLDRLRTFLMSRQR